MGKVRYGLMLRDDGFVMDDGTTARMNATHYIMTTTTANAVSVFRHLEFCRQCLRPDLDVQLISTTDQYAQYAIAGPNARRLLGRIVDDSTAITNEAMPFMGCAEISICGGIPARLFRISFSGELAYELAVARNYGDALMRHLMECGKPDGITPYGVEALGVMRIEKGHPAGGELNGQTSAHHLGLGRMLASNKDYIGKAMASRHELTRTDGVRLVGLIPLNRQNSIGAGAHILPINSGNSAKDDAGWVSSVAYSPMLGSSIALASLRRATNVMAMRCAPMTRCAPKIPASASPARISLTPKGAGFMAKLKASSALDGFAINANGVKCLYVAGYAIAALATRKARKNASITPSARDSAPASPPPQARWKLPKDTSSRPPATKYLSARKPPPKNSSPPPKNIAAPAPASPTKAMPGCV